MIERKCENCDRNGAGWSKCSWEPGSTSCLPAFLPSRAALEAEVEKLREEEEEWKETFFRERNKLISAIDRAVARANEERAERAGLEEQLAEAERRRDDARAEAATRKTFLDSSIAALRQALNDRDLFAGRARRYRAALREANRGRKLALARAAEARVRELEARTPRLPEVEPQSPTPEVGEDPP